MATIHGPGVKLWGRTPEVNENGEPNWVVVRRFEHHRVQRIHFSPNENYLVTFCPISPENDDKRNPRCILIHDIRTGKVKRGFLGPSVALLLPEGQIPWPVFQWSHNDKYFARRNEGTISVYSTPDFGLLDKKSIKLPKVQDFAWSPCEDHLAYWVPENENSPARVSILAFPSRKEIRSKALYSVDGIRLHWHQQGYFLCCKVDRMTKSKKGRFTNFEMFRVRAKDIPVEVLEFKEKDTIEYFEWEPNGHRFAIIHGNRDTPQRLNCSFYTMGGLSGELKLLNTLENKTYNRLHWSPKGRFALLACVAAQNGALAFFDANDIVPNKKDEPEPIGVNDHFMCNEVHWDPSGRFVATVASYWRNRSDNGYKIWSVVGKELGKGEVDKLYQFCWRPRPRSLLSNSKEREVRKNLKSKREHYEKDDKQLKESVSSGRAALRRKQAEEWEIIKKQIAARVAQETERRFEANRCKKEDADYEDIEEELEEIISTVKEKTDIKLLSEEDERD